MEAIALEHERLAKKQRSAGRELASQLDALIGELEGWKGEGLGSSGTTATSPLSPRLAAHPPPPPPTRVIAIKERASKIQEAQRDLQTTLHKYSKALDKRFKVDLDSVHLVNPRAFEGKEGVVDKALAFHAIREGRFAVADSLIREAGLSYPEATALKHGFQDLHHILECLRKRQLAPAIQWASGHSEQLGKKGSSLEFELHKLQFLQHLLTLPSLLPALEYAKRHFPPFSDVYLTEIKRLMCSVLYLKKLDRSPYARLYEEGAWDSIQHLFTKEYCQHLGLPSESPLYVAVTVGTNALPTLIKMASVMRNVGTEWSQSDELPVEIPLQDSHHFHSVFVCPVSKDLCTSEENPPMMMQCGHVISKESLMRIAKGNVSARFKCPYCPMETTASQALRVFF